MKKTLLACSCLFLAAPALAADLPTRAPAPAPVYAAAPVFTWTGFYVGAQGGYAWGKSKWTAAGESLTLKPKGVIGGVHAGYNWQTGALVLGVEADLEYAGVKVRRTIDEDVLTSKIGNRGSARLRAGYAVDRALLYVTAGLAAADVKQTVLSDGGLAKFSKTKIGWTAGAGVEYAFTRNLSGRVEYRYSDFGSFSFTAGEDTIKFKQNEHAVRVGLSYHFGGSTGPVVARY